jgi:hypothetical protein
MPALARIGGRKVASGAWSRMTSEGSPRAALVRFERAGKGYEAAKGQKRKGSGGEKRSENARQAAAKGAK